MNPPQKPSKSNNRPKSKIDTQQMQGWTVGDEITYDFSQPMSSERIFELFMEQVQAGLKQ